MARRFVSSSSQNLRDSTWADLAYYNKATLSVWLKRTSSTSEIGAGSFYNVFNRFYVKLNSSGSLSLGHSAGDFTENSSVALSGTDWHHVFLVFDGTLSGNSNRIKCWVDGVQQTLSFGGAGAPSSMGPNLDDFEIGSEGGTYQNGDVALCYVWRGVAHGEAQAQEYAAQTADETSYTTGLRGAWLLDETTSTDDAADSSGNSSTLVQSGSPEWVADPDPIGGGGGGVVIPVFMHHYRQQGIA